MKKPIHLLRMLCALDLNLSSPHFNFVSLNNHVYEILDIFMHQKYALTKSQNVFNQHYRHKKHLEFIPYIYCLLKKLHVRYLIDLSFQVTTTIMEKLSSVSESKRAHLIYSFFKDRHCTWLSSPTFLLLHTGELLLCGYTQNVNWQRTIEFLLTVENIK